MYFVNHHVPDTRPHSAAVIVLYGQEHQHNAAAMRSMVVSVRGRLVLLLFWPVNITKYTTTVSEIYIEL